MLKRLKSCRWTSRARRRPSRSGALLLTCLLGCAALTSCTREVPVRVPTPAPRCALPPFHVQAACGDDINCLLTEFALTLQAEQAVQVALSACGVGA